MSNVFHSIPLWLEQSESKLQSLPNIHKIKTITSWHLATTYAGSEEAFMCKLPSITFKYFEIKISNTQKILVNYHLTTAEKLLQMLISANKCIFIRSGQNKIFDHVWYSIYHKLEDRNVQRRKCKTFTI